MNKVETPTHAFPSPLGWSPSDSDTPSCLPPRGLKRRLSLVEHTGPPSKRCRRRYIEPRTPVVPPAIHLQRARFQIERTKRQRAAHKAAIRMERIGRQERRRTPCTTRAPSPQPSSPTQRPSCPPRTLRRRKLAVDATIPPEGWWLLVTIQRRTAADADFSRRHNDMRQFLIKARANIHHQEQKKEFGATMEQARELRSMFDEAIVLGQSRNGGYRMRAMAFKRLNVAEMMRSPLRNEL
ncbi:hypothetical protein CYLTODRAFT_426751 [Cylindrobasidium torrendii FP15055 ss-10]|uniref:Uncharacterized protein n=1 Tax=Cylindrobasidium torrendii FP15055 ss-10 TaxID=1314674 RepID=A0A0D7AWM8_9AGAR|nr:hypothetical protein CYLTODRAFT_426751 [Cylindrobasidium torrendii FP15055 ss-10]